MVPEVREAGVGRAGHGGLLGRRRTCGAEKGWRTIVKNARLLKLLHYNSRDVINVN